MLLHKGVAPSRGPCAPERAVIIETHRDNGAIAPLVIASLAHESRNLLHGGNGLRT